MLLFVCLSVGLSVCLSDLVANSGMVKYGTQISHDTCKWQRHLEWRSVGERSGLPNITTSVRPHLLRLFRGLSVQRHEPYVDNRQVERLSFEGFSCYLMDQENFAVSPDYGCRLKDVSLLVYVIVSVIVCFC